MVEVTGMWKRYAIQAAGICLNSLTPNPSPGGGWEMIAAFANPPFI
jgi:hypothetical protein